jgi:hypothetical protein
MSYYRIGSSTGANSNIVWGPAQEVQEPNIFVKLEELKQQLQAETQRADKAEALIQAKFNEGFWLVNDATLKASRQKLCDEIVGKIDGRDQFKSHCSERSVALSEAIDIAKSVLSEEV